MIKTVIKAAQEAGEYLKSEFGKTYPERKSEEYFSKGYRQVKSEIDLKVNEIIWNKLSKIDSSFGYLSEEAEKNILKSETCWVVDPLCGTITYLRGITNYSISIALVRKNKVILGVVYSPSTDELFIAERGKGSYLNNQKINISLVSKLEDSLTEIQHAVFRKEEYQKAIFTISKTIKRLRISDAMGLALSYVACGKTDAILNLIQPLYDYAAGWLILEEAGGRLSDFEGNPIKVILDNERRYDILASNGKIHTKLLEILNL